MEKKVYFLEKTTLLYPDLIRAVGILLILLLHVAAALFYAFSEKWTIGLYFDSFTRVGVPLFFMLSGALLIPKQETIRSFMQKRLLKVVIPLIIWSCIYALWKYYFHKQAFTNLPTNLPLAILKGPVYYHLGFIYIIIGLYLVTPIIRPFFQNSNAYVKTYFLLFCVLAASLLPLYSLLSGKPNPIGIDLQFFNGWIGYFVLGAFIVELFRLRDTQNNTKNNTKHNIGKNKNSIIAESTLIKYRIFSLGIFIIGSLSTAFLTDWRSHTLGTPNEAFFEYLSINVVIAALGLFCFLQSFEQILQRSPKMFRYGMASLSKTSFGIYLLHPIILELFASGLMPVPLTAQLGNPLFSIPLVTGLCLGVSYLIIVLLQKIPIIKYCVP